MQTLSYNLSADLLASLQTIETLRRQILLTPLPPREELHLRWEAMMQRIYWALALDDHPLTKAAMVRLLTAQEKKKLSPFEHEVLNYKKAFDFISQDWLVNPKPLSIKAVLTLYELTYQRTGRRLVTTLPNSIDIAIKNILEYLHTGSENPVIQAAIAYAQLESIAPFPEGNARVARLLVYLLLYKYGHDCRGLLVLEEYWRRDLLTLRKTLEIATQEKNYNPWLEFFAHGVVSQLQKTVENLSSERFQIDIAGSFFDLNDRQKEILTLLDQPGASISNKKVQRLFKVSQITASRDLTRLATLGLLFTHGKGRSVYYTRV